MIMPKEVCNLPRVSIEGSRSPFSIFAIVGSMNIRSGGEKSEVGLDAYAYSLDYFKDDYKPIGGSTADAFKEAITYDGNGNILTYERNGSIVRGTTMDKLSYGYARDAAGNLLHNRLLQVKDAVDNPQYTEDLKSQGDNNYIYDNIGNLVYDREGGISKVEWTVYG
jgi:YD repeat-containing protein